MHRKKPFSGKAKKEQLKAKRQQKSKRFDSGNDNRPDAGGSDEEPGLHSGSDGERPQEVSKSDEEKTNQRSSSEDEDIEAIAAGSSKRNARGQRSSRLKTVFELESREEIEERKRQSREPLDIEKRSKPWHILDEYINQDPIDIPKRPPWNYSESAEELERRERQAFADWIKYIKDNFAPNRLNYFEQNLEVWRQLWRVAERADIVALITDARYPLFHFPPALYSHVVNDLKKPILLVLNKIDLVDPKVVEAWEHYFRIHYPGLKTVTFSSFSTAVPSQQQDEFSTDKKRRMIKGRRRYEAAQGVERFLDALRQFHIEKNGKLIDIRPVARAQKKQEESDNNTEEEERSSSDDEQSSSDEDRRSTNTADNNNNNDTNEKNDDNIVVVGMVGHPNVGKSSLINGLIGKKVVSASRTPGHTKYFQTIYLSPDVLLVDCPGLVFPALDRPKALQMLCGLFPLAQVREPFSAIRYLAERVPLEKVYNLKKVEEDEPWSPWTICEAYAIKKGYLISRTGRPDVHRAGLEILRDCLDGKIVVSWPPPMSTLEGDAQGKQLVHSTANDTFAEHKEAEQQGPKEETQKQQHDNEQEEAEEKAEVDEEERRLLKKEKKRQQKLKKAMNAQLGLDSNDEEEAADEAKKPKAKKKNNEEHQQQQPQQLTTTTITAIKKAKNKKKAEREAEYAERLAEKAAKSKAFRK